MKEVKILGPGCSKCEMLAKRAEEAAGELGIECQVVKVKDIQEIMKYGVMMTPGLVIDGMVKSVGKVLSVEKLKEMLS